MTFLPEVKGLKPVSFLSSEAISWILLNVEGVNAKEQATQLCQVSGDVFLKFNGGGRVGKHLSLYARRNEDAFFSWIILFSFDGVLVSLKWNSIWKICAYCALIPFLKNSWNQNFSSSLLKRSLKIFFPNRENSRNVMHVEVWGGRRKAVKFFSFGNHHFKALGRGILFLLIYSRTRSKEPCLAHANL